MDNQTKLETTYLIKDTYYLTFEEMNEKKKDHPKDGFKKIFSDQVFLKYVLNPLSKKIRFQFYLFSFAV
jgi:hypothetical protein